MAANSLLSVCVPVITAGWSMPWLEPQFFSPDFFVPMRRSADWLHDTYHFIHSLSLSLTFFSVDSTQEISSLSLSSKRRPFYLNTFYLSRVQWESQEINPSCINVTITGYDRIRKKERKQNEFLFHFRSCWISKDLFSLLQENRRRFAMYSYSYVHK